MTEAEENDASGAEPNPMGAWLRERLTGPQGREDWTRLVEASWQTITATPLRVLVPPDQARSLVEAHLTPEHLAELVRPVVEVVLPRVVEAHRDDPSPVGRWVPDAARGAIERMVSRPGLVHEDWIRALFRQRVVEAVMSDALYRGIRDFSTIMPRLMLSFMPAGRLSRISGAGSLGKRAVEELEKRIEPEIKVFLEGGTKRALLRAADFAVEHRDDDAALAFRRNVVQFVLTKSPRFHTHALTDEVLADVGPIAQMVAKHVATRDETRTLVDQAIAWVDETYGDKPVGDVLREIGIEHPPDLDAWAAVTWPGLVACMQAPDVQAWMDGLVDELLREHARRNASG